jgi:hypothetical protein
MPEDSVPLGHLQDEIERLRRHVRDLEVDLVAERHKNKAIEDGIRDLKRATWPLLNALQQIHGLIAPMGIGDPANENAGPASDKWTVIKQRYPGRIADAIDALLAHGSMNASQLAAALKMDRSNCSKNLVPKLAQLGLIVRNGRELTLKAL